MGERAMMNDVVGEWILGQGGAVRLIAKSIVRKASSGGPILVASVCYRTDGQNELVAPETEVCERWDGELILLPRCKFSGQLPDGRHAHAGLRIDQILCGNSLDNEAYWGPAYWGQPPRPRSERDG